MSKPRAVRPESVWHGPERSRRRFPAVWRPVLAALVAGVTLAGVPAAATAGEPPGPTVEPSGVTAEPSVPAADAEHPGGTVESGGVLSPEPGGGGESAVRRQPVRIIAHTRHVRFNGVVTVKGVSGLASRGRVRVQFRAKGSRKWKTFRTVGSTGKGWFRARIRIRRNGFVRALDRLGRASSRTGVRVRSVIRLKRVAATVKLGHRLRISGTIRPRGVRRVRVRIAGGNKAVVVSSRRSGNFTYRWKPQRAGDVRIRALAFGNRKATKDRSGHRRSSALRPGGASYYGPGLYGNGVACGGVLRPGTVGVAHKTLPCGTKVKFKYGHRVVSARVIDRGPYIAGRDWDLTAALRDRLGFGGVGTVWTNR